jgi:hypothetical protein
MGDSFLEKLFCKRPMMERDNYERTGQALSQEIIALEIQIENLEQAKEDLITAAASSSKENMQKIDTLNGKIASLEQLAAQLQAQIAQGLASSLYRAPCPAWLDEIDANKVMLGQFIMRTSLGSFYITYPSHPAIFFPCPWFEQTLNAADCNRRRDDLTPIQICEKIGNVCQKRRRYVPDQNQWGIADCWPPAFLTTPLGGEDCETEALEEISAMDYYQLKFGIFKDYSVLLGLGHLKVGLQNLGHGFVVVMHNTSTDLKDSFIIEATLETASFSKSFSEAKTDYIIDWGLIGYTRDTHPEGTYWMKNSLAWWGATSVRVVGEGRDNIIKKIKRKIFHEKSDKEKKQDHIHKIWENKRR